METRIVPAQLNQIQKALAAMETTLKEQGCKIVMDREDGVYRIIPDRFYLDDKEEHGIMSDENDIDKSEFSTIDVPIDIYDDYYHGIYPRKQD